MEHHEDNAYFNHGNKKKSFHNIARNCLAMPWLLMKKLCCNGIFGIFFCEQNEYSFKIEEPENLPWIGQKFRKFWESDKSLKHEIGFNFKILSLIRVLLVLW